MNDQEKSVLAALGADAKVALKALLKEIVDKDIPALEAAEAQKLPVAYQPLVAIVFGALYPELQKMLDAKIDAL